MPNENEVANGIAFISAFVGCCSALVAFLSYRKSVAQYNINKKDMFFSNCRNRLDDCYMELNDFVRNFSDTEESKEKRTARDKILYLLEILRVDMESSSLVCSTIKSSYGALGMKISDITYEENYEKIFRDLGVIKDSISTLKGKFVQGT